MFLMGFDDVIWYSNDPRFFIPGVIKWLLVLVCYVLRWAFRYLSCG